MIPRLKAKEPSRCNKCMFCDEQLFCHYSNEKTVQEEATDWCSYGRWVVRYKPKTYSTSLSEVVTGRARREIREGVK